MASALLTFVREKQFALQVKSAPATVTRPYPDDTPITTRIIWLVPASDAVPSGADFARTDVRRLVAIRRDEVPTVPTGTRISGAEPPSDVVREWVTEGPVTPMDADHVRVFVVEADEA
jgi:hypothetical protein